MKRKDIPSDYETELKNCFDKWDHLNEYGGSDPSFADGVNMDLERNHIIYFKAKIEETLPPYPEIYYRDTPPKVDINYIARPDEIRKNAAASLKLFEQSDSFQFLQTAVKNISDKQAEDLHIHNILGYEKTLRIAISKDDLITMRRYEDPKRYIESFEQAAEAVRSLEPEENFQMRLF